MNRDINGKNVWIEEAKDFFTQESVLVMVSLKKPGNHKRLKAGEQAQVTVDADPDALSISKELLDSRELRNINAFDLRIRQWLYRRAVQSVGLKSGVYRVPLTMLDEIDNRLDAFKAERSILVEKFLDTYDDRVAEAKIRLRSLFKSFDYPSAERIRLAFEIEWRYMTVGVPARLQGTKRGDREQSKAELAIESEMMLIRDALRASFVELMDNAVRALGTRKDKDGQKKPAIFRDSMVEKMTEFFDFFQQRNLTLDEDLAVLVEQANQILKGKGPKVLRDDKSIRNAVRKGFEGIQKEMAENVEFAPTRKISFDDE